MGAYCIVALVNCWLLWRCMSVWGLAQTADPKWLVTHYAQWQIVFCFTCALVALCLSVFMVGVGGWQAGWLSHWWAVFDVAVAFAFLSTLQFFEKSLSAGRKGSKDEGITGSAE